MKDRTLPAAPDAEKAVLACLLFSAINGDSRCRRIVFQGLSAGDFLDPDISELFATMARMAAAGQPLEVDLVATEAQSRVPEAIAILRHEIAPCVATTGSVAAYVRQVAEASTKRQIHLAAVDLASRALNGEAPDALLVDWRATGEDLSRAVSGGPGVESFPLCDFVAQDHRVEFLINAIMPKAAGGGIFAKSKGQKTTTTCGTMFGLATGTPALGRFEVPHARACGIMSGESGAATIAETFQRIAKAHQIDIRDVNNLHVSTEVPQMALAEGLARVERFIERYSLEALAIDPTYLAFAGVEDTQLSKMAVVLAPLNGIIERTGCSIVLVHHNRKTTPSPYAEPTLEEIGGTGFSQWVRFWILLNKRREWDPNEGRHWLWFCSGSSAGFGHRYFLDVHEGRRSDSGGRVWDLEFSEPSEGQQREREQQTAEKEAAKLESERRAVCDALAGHPAGLSWSKALKLANVSQRRWDVVRETMIDEGDVEETTITVSNHKTPLPGVKLASAGVT